MQCCRRLQEVSVKHDLPTVHDIYYFARELFIRAEVGGIPPPFTSCPSRQLRLVYDTALSGV